MAKRKKKNEIEETEITCPEGECVGETGCEDCNTKKTETQASEGDVLVKVRVKHGYRLHVDGKFFNRDSILTVAKSKIADQSQKYEVLKNA